MYKVISYSDQHYEFVADTSADLDKIVARGKPWAIIGTTCYVISDSTTYVLDSENIWHPLVSMSGGGGGGSTEPGTSVSDAVRYNTVQQLSEAQQARAQANIGIVGATEENLGLVKGGTTTNISEDGSIEVVSMDIGDLTQDGDEEVVFNAGGAASYN